MYIEDFKAGYYVQQFKYKSFSPVMINHEWSWKEAKINGLLEHANMLLGGLNAYSSIVPDVDLYINMHVLKEAVTSSRIEGTQTNINEAVMDEEDVHPEKRDDRREVLNYVEALNTAIEALETLPLSNRLLKNAHSILLSGVRGENKYRGEFRKSQNWIGGSNLSDAVYIPPAHTEVPELMSDLEKFLHNEELFTPDLIKIAIAHHQFETIHPFLDGNGRIGRLLIPLYLVSKNILDSPSLYVSDFFERNRSSYYDALMRVRSADDLSHWIKFFLNAVIDTAQKGKETFAKIKNLKEEVDRFIVELGRRGDNARKLVNQLFNDPKTSAKKVENKLDISKRSAQELIKAFEEKGILVEYTGKKRHRKYIFEKYIDIF